MEKVTKNDTGDGIDKYMDMITVLNEAFGRRFEGETDNERVLALLTKMIEEFGEFSVVVRAALGRERSSRIADDKIMDKIKDESADIIIVLLGILETLGVKDVDKAIEKKLQIVANRLRETNDM